MSFQHARRPACLTISAIRPPARTTPSPALQRQWQRQHGPPRECARTSGGSSAHHCAVQQLIIIFRTGQRAGRWRGGEILDLLVLP